MLYQMVPKDEIADRMVHLRDLYRQRRARTVDERIAHEKRETITKNFLDNLFRTKEHPTLRAVLEVAEIFSLTLDGAHRLFGYDLDALRRYDLDLNGGRTHILDAYPYHRDFRIDLPLRFASDSVFHSMTALPDLVPAWQTDLPIRVIDDPVWTSPGVFYVHVGTQDSFGSNLPPGATALVEPILPAEQRRPDPRTVYLLQFGNGYRCSRCVVTGRKLFLISDESLSGTREFVYPGAVRIAGRIRGISMTLPIAEYRDMGSLPSSSRMASLVLPWEHDSLDRLLAAKHNRFIRSREEQSDLQRVLESILATRLTERTERRYRRPSLSHPHVNTLLLMVLSHTARYSDALRAAQSLPSDHHRFSLETLLEARTWHDVVPVLQRGQFPQPSERWRSLRERYIEWPALLSMQYPHLSALQDCIVRLSEGVHIKGLSPPLAPGSVLLLDTPSTVKEPSESRPNKGKGWSRPLYALQRGGQVVCGYLRIERERWELIPDLQHAGPISLVGREVEQLRRVCGAIIPM